MVSRSSVRLCDKELECKEEYWTNENNFDTKLSSMDSFVNKETTRSSSM